MNIDEHPVKEYLPKVSKPIATDVVVTSPKCDGSFPGWIIDFIVPKGSPRTPGEIVDQVHRLLPGGQVDTVTVTVGGKFSIKVLGTRYLDKPPGIDSVHNWLRSSLLVKWTPSP